MLGRRPVELEPERVARRTDDNNRYSSILKGSEPLSTGRKSHLMEGGHHEHDHSEETKDAVNQVNNIFKSGGVDLSGGIRNLVSEKTDYI